jgi:hypothetical protein
MDRQQLIYEQAKKIMNDFFVAIKDTPVCDVGVMRVKQTRIPRQHTNNSTQLTKLDTADFKQRILDNAPTKDQDCIIAEKKSW